MSVGSGAFEVGSNSLVTQMLNPKLSRPFIQSLHAFISLGFATGTTLLTGFQVQCVSVHEKKSLYLMRHPVVKVYFLI